MHGFVGPVQGLFVAVDTAVRIAEAKSFTQLIVNAVIHTRFYISSYVTAQEMIENYVHWNEDIGEWQLVSSPCITHALCDFIYAQHT